MMENTSQDSISQHLIIRELKGIREALESIANDLHEVDSTSTNREELIEYYEAQVNESETHESVKYIINNLPLKVTCMYDDFISIQELYLAYLKETSNTVVSIKVFSKLFKEELGLTPSTTRRVNGKATRVFVGIKWNE